MIHPLILGVISGSNGEAEVVPEPQADPVMVSYKPNISSVGGPDFSSGILTTDPNGDVTIKQNASGAPFAAMSTRSTRIAEHEQGIFLNFDGLPDTSVISAGVAFEFFNGGFPMELNLDLLGQSTVTGDPAATVMTIRRGDEVCIAFKGQSGDIIYTVYINGVSVLVMTINNSEVVPRSIALGEPVRVVIMSFANTNEGQVTQIKSPAYMPANVSHFEEYIDTSNGSLMAKNYSSGSASKALTQSNGDFVAGTNIDLEIAVYSNQHTHISATERGAFFKWGDLGQGGGSLIFNLVNLHAGGGINYALVIQRIPETSEWRVNSYIVEGNTSYSDASSSQNIPLSAIPEGAEVGLTAKVFGQEVQSRVYVDGLLVASVSLPSPASAVPAAVAELTNENGMCSFYVTQTSIQSGPTDYHQINNPALPPGVALFYPN